MKILELTQRFAPALGGVEQHVEHLATELLRAGFAVEVATSDLARDRPFARITAPTIPMAYPVYRHRAMRTVPAPHGLGIVAPGLLGQALNSRVDLLHAHAFGYFPTWVASATHRLRKVPLVITPHTDQGSGTPGSRTYARAVARATLSTADRVVAQSRREQLHLESLGVDPGRIERIPTPFDLAEFAFGKTTNDLRENPVLLFVGRIYPEQKGLDVLVRALSKLRGTVAPMARLIGEDWGGKDWLTRLARDVGVQDRVTFTGILPRAAVLHEFQSADIFVLPSRFDSFPVVLLEAMASGLPVVATDVGAIPEIVAHGKSGLVVPPGDVDRLAESLGRLMADPALRHRLGEEAKRASKAYSWEKLAPRYVSMFTDLARAS